MINIEGLWKDYCQYEQVRKPYDKAKGALEELLLVRAGKEIL
jgi:hypothetical protein